MKPTEPSPRNSAWVTPREAAEYLHVGVDIIDDACAASGLKHTAWGTAPFAFGGSGWMPGPRLTRASRSEVRPCRSEVVAASGTCTRSTTPSVATASR